MPTEYCRITGSASRGAKRFTPSRPKVIGDGKKPGRNEINRDDADWLYDNKLAVMEVEGNE